MCLGTLAAVMLLSSGFLARPGAAPSDISRTKSNLAGAQALESKMRILSGADPAAQSFRPIVITENEANAYLKYHGHEFLPPGVSDPSLHISPERVFGAAAVDFEAFSQATSSSSNWGPKVLALMFKGRQRVTAAGKLSTEKGLATVKIVTVAIGSSALPDWLVDFLLENYLQPRYKFDLSKPFVLPGHVTRIELGSGRATFFRSPQKSR